MKTKITIPKQVKYISEILKIFPKGVVQKGRTGAGCTTIALTNSVPTIITVPFVSLIENKLAQHENILGVYGKADYDLLSYLTNTEVPKIMVTYDSLDVLIKDIQALGFDVFGTFTLVVDEYHLLFTQYSFRDKAIKSVLRLYKLFDNYTFITATPVEDDFVLEELKEEDITEFEWEDNQTITIESVRCNKSVDNTVITLIERFVNEEIEGNAYIFVNSVNYIAEIIAKINKSKLSFKLNAENTRLVYSKNSNNPSKIAKIPRGTVNDPVKKINFLTSTVWEGSDIYDEKGKIYIVSNGSKKHTLVDISTSFQQIAGRIRNTKYWQKIHHIFTETRYSEIGSYNEFKKLSENEIKEANYLLGELFKMDKIARDKLPIIDNPYITKDDDFIFDPNLVKLDLYQYKLVSCTYSLQANIQKEYQKYSYFSVLKDDSEYKPSEVINAEILPTTLKEVIEILKEFYPPSDKPILSYNIDFKYLAFKKYPYLKNIIDILGYDYIEKENYTHTNLKRKAIQLAPLTQKDKIKSILSNYIKENRFYNTKQIYKFLCDAYEIAGINKKPKSTEILNFYNAKSKIIKKEDESIRGFFIYN